MLGLGSKHIHGGAGNHGDGGGGGGGGTRTVSHIFDGSAVTLGSADGDGLRTISGGGIVSGEAVLFDPQEVLDVTSYSGVIDWEVTAGVPSGHYAPGESANWFVNGPAVIFKGLLGTGCSLLVEDMEVTVGANANYRVAPGIFSLRETPYNVQLWEGGNIYPSGGNYNYRLQGRIGGLRPVYVSDTSITGPVDWQQSLTRTPGLPNTFSQVFNLNGSDVHTATKINVSHGNFAIAFAGVAAGTYRTGPITVRTLALP